MDRCYRVKLFQNIGNNSIYDLRQIGFHCPSLTNNINMKAWAPFNH